MNFDVFLVDFDAKTQMRGENLPKIQNGGRKKGARTDPQMGREKFSEIFEGVGKLFLTRPRPFRFYGEIKAKNSSRHAQCGKVSTL